MPSTYSTAADLNRQIDAVMRNLRGVLVDYNDKDRRKITRKAAQKVAVAARRNTGFKDSEKPHTRSSGGQSVTYNPGNLRRSLRVLTLSKTLDAYVGPQFATRKSAEYGGPGQPVDGYYAAMIYGSAELFLRRELYPALQRGKSAALSILKTASDKAIQARGLRRGFKRN